MQDTTDLRRHLDTSGAAVGSCIWRGTASAVSTAEASDGLGQAKVDEDEERHM